MGADRGEQLTPAGPADRLRPMGGEDVADAGPAPSRRRQCRL
ncbi:hypothetical protein [Pseudonocardia sp. T1-2H]